MVGMLNFKICISKYDALEVVQIIILRQNSWEQIISSRFLKNYYIEINTLPYGIL